MADMVLQIKHQVIIMKIKPVKYLTTGHPRSILVKKNMLASLFIKGLSIFISLLLVPLTIHYINPTRYGVWITLSSIIGWFGFFDIGLGNGLRNNLTEAIAKNQHELARIYISTTYAILFIIITVFLVLFFIVNPFLNCTKILNTPAEMGNELSILALIVFTFFCLQLVFQLMTIVLTADQKPAISSAINLAGGVLSLIIIVILTKTTNGSLFLLGLTLSAVPVVILIISNIWFYNYKYKIYAPSLKYVKFSYAEKLMTLGLRFFIIQIAAIVLFQTNNIIITQLFGPEQVTPYNIAYKYFSITTMVYAIITTPLWSAFTDAWAKGDIQWIKKIINKMRSFWYWMTILTLFMLLVSHFAYFFWIGETVKIPIILSCSLALNVIIIGWNTIYVQFINGVGKLKLQLLSGVFGTLITIPLAVYFGKIWGISGVVFSSCLLGFINTGWTYFQYNKIINNKAEGIWNK
jgi:O-antigen/teichoic acid export membrane protein